jgi:hypothetical protein
MKPESKNLFQLVWGLLRDIFIYIKNRKIISAYSSSNKVDEKFNKIDLKKDELVDKINQMNENQISNNLNNIHNRR